MKMNNIFELKWLHAISSIHLSQVLGILAEFETFRKSDDRFCVLV